MKYKIGDKVKIISGFYKNDIGEVIKINRKAGTIIVKNVNFKYKHIKSNEETKNGEIREMEAPIDHSNVKLLDN
uniref:Large ribosomal subunit protein uL24c n=1 Tax=Astrosyne radiata TaxID=1158023 RepID=A0A2U9NT93_9STRA|nr:ribosomal protein L24 [Astrosyne radiata]AWT40360.1 ribosomal protein L24 [Astrosyne radiata]